MISVARCARISCERRLQKPALGGSTTNIMMLTTALKHFNEDLERATGLCSHAAALPAGSVRDDILRAGWMMSVGACDAYFSDAYGDLIARTLRAKELQPAVVIPDRLNDLKVPVTAILRESKGGWRWRMAARELIEEENVLSLEKIKKLFNHFFRKSHKLLIAGTIEPWILHKEARSRLFGITPTEYRALTPKLQSSARESALDHFEEHFQMIFQRRHDCIHNCDRPKMALQPITVSNVEKRLEDISFLVHRAHEGLTAEFPVYLTDLGFNAVTRNRVLM
ncbi:MAG: hypothetical protein MUE84_05690 [Hyphomonas sp.]|nr:hypothetical protein [Hyphomonas sp.]